MFRFAIKTSAWQPTASEWLRAAATISPGERERVAAYMFKRDAKQTMAGRLLIRHCLSSLTSLPPESFVLERDGSGKPYLVSPALPSFQFNVSHAGQYAVFVGCASGGVGVGVDVMRVELRRGTSIERFFTHMERQFTAHEWRVIRGSGSEHAQLASFYRHWCLKESYVKTIGTGLKFGLQRIEFQLGGELEEEGGLCEGTTVRVDGEVQEGWRFEERAHDGHISTIAIRGGGGEELMGGELEVLEFGDLRVCADELEDEGYFKEFDAKREIPG